MAAARGKILVLGGTGFVGSEICRRAVKVGFKVTSLSRRGQIPHARLKIEDMKEWHERVDWRSGNATHKEVMEPLIKEHDAIIHSIGILLEGGINTLVSGCSSDATGISYELANMESALLPLSILESQPTKGRPKPFVFISALSAPPFLGRYLTTKRVVEKRMIEDEEKQIIRSIIFRPGIVYHHSKLSSLPIARLTVIINSMDRFAQRNLGIGFGIPEPTPLDLLATSAVRAVARSEVHGIFTNKEMWELTSTANPEI